MKLSEEEADLLLRFSQMLVNAAKTMIVFDRLILEALLGEREEQPTAPEDIEDMRVRAALEESADRLLHRMGAKSE